MPLTSTPGTTPVTEEDIPEERLGAKQVVSSTYIPVGYHISGSTSGSVITLTTPEDAQFLKLQAITDNIRYRIDGEEPTTATGFQLAAGSDVLIPVAVDEINFINEGQGGTYEAQWVR